MKGLPHLTLGLNRIRQDYEGKGRRYRFGHWMPETVGLSLVFLFAFGFAGSSALIGPQAGYVWGAAALCFFVGFFKKLREFRSVANVPTSKIASAAQGFAEFKCWVREDSLILFAPKVRVRCVWYHHIIQENRSPPGEDAEWVLIDDYVCPRPVWLEDGSGQSLLAHPAFLIQSSFTHLLIEEDFGGLRPPRRHRVYVLEPGDQLLVNGLFASFNQPDEALASHLVGPRGQDAIQSCLAELQYLAEVEPVDLSGSRRWHALGYCNHHKMGVLHGGEERDYLKSARLGLIISTFMLLLAFTFLMVSTY